MKRSRFADEQIIAIVKEQEAGMATAEVCRRNEISGATFYKWKAEDGGLEVSEASRALSSESCAAGALRRLASSRHQRRSVSVVQPILPAIDVNAAHSQA